MGDPWLGALALALLLEGLLPLLSPPAWRRLFEQASRLSDGQIRFLGLCAVGLGAALWTAWRLWR